MYLSTRERILMLRLMENLQKHPAYATLLGVEVNAVSRDLNTKTEPKDH